MNTERPTNHSITLESISQHKMELKRKIDKQKDKIVEEARNIFIPEQPSSGMEAMMQSFNKGLAIYDGVMMGIKMIRRVRHFFQKKK